MARTPGRHWSRTTAAAFVALALSLGVSMTSAHAQTVYAGALVSDSAGDAALSLTPTTSTGIAALDTACGTSQLSIDGSGVITAGINGAVVLGIPIGDLPPVPFPASGGSDYAPWTFTVTGGACNDFVGTAVLDFEGTGATGGTFSCPDLEGRWVDVGATVQFTVTGVCAVNNWHTTMTFNSIGVAAAGVPGSTSETVDSVLYSEQTGDPCC